MAESKVYGAPRLSRRGLEEAGYLSPGSYPVRQESPPNAELQSALDAYEAVLNLRECYRILDELNGRLDARLRQGSA